MVMPVMIVYLGACEAPNLSHSTLKRYHIFLFEDEVKLASITFLLSAGFGCCRTLVKLFTDYRC